MSNNIVVISADGHASARMEEYRPYIDKAYLEEFDAFEKVYRTEGTKSTDPRNLRGRLDPEVVDEWIREVVETGRLTGYWDPERRLREMEGQGVVAEVIIPEFGLPFEMHQPSECALKGYPLRTQVQTEVGNRAYNRWLADMITAAPNRFAAMAAVDFRDVEGAVRELRWCRDHGLSGVMMPMFDEEMPLFDARHDPIWSALEELDMVVNCHIAISSTSRSAWLVLPPLPHPACGPGIVFPVIEFYAHEVLGHLVWGGVFERHPRLKVAMTEQGSGWLIDYVAAMEHRYTNSFMRRDIRQVVRRSPREYVERQCYVGSTLLSRAEVERRHEIGIDKMMFGVDYPHHEGTWRAGTQDYLRATFGYLGVPEDETRKILGENAAKFYGFDLASLQPLADKFGPSAASILTVPGPEIEEKFARGDLHKPVAALI